MSWQPCCCPSGTIGTSCCVANAPATFFLTIATNGSALDAYIPGVYEMTYTNSDVNGAYWRYGGILGDPLSGTTVSNCFSAVFSDYMYTHAPIFYCGLIGGVWNWRVSLQHGTTQQFRCLHQNGITTLSSFDCATMTGSGTMVFANGIFGNSAECCGTPALPLSYTFTVAP